MCLGRVVRVCVVGWCVCHPDVRDSPSDGTAVRPIQCKDSPPPTHVLELVDADEDARGRHEARHHRVAHEADHRAQAQDRHEEEDGEHVEGERHGCLRARRPGPLRRVGDVEAQGLEGDGDVDAAERDGADGQVLGGAEEGEHEGPERRRVEADDGVWQVVFVGACVCQSRVLLRSGDRGTRTERREDHVGEGLGRDEHGAAQGGDHVVEEGLECR